MTSSAAEVDAGVSVLFTRGNNNGLPKMEAIRVTTALIMATNTGVSNFLSVFFSGSGGGGTGVPRREVVGSFEDGEGGSEQIIAVSFVEKICVYKM